MSTNLPGAAGGTLAPDELSVLIGGDDIARVDRFIPPLRRAGFSVRRMPAGAAAAKLIREHAFDLVVIVLPLASLGDVLEAVRGEGTPGRRVALAVIAGASLDPQHARALGAHANRMLPADCTPEDLQKTATLLLRPAPRVAVNASARIQLGPHGGEARTLPVQNLSATGMLLTSREPPAVGTTFGFELTVPSIEAPIRGQAQVVRLTPVRGREEQGIAANFISIGGDGVRLLESLIFQQRAAAGARQWSSRTGSFAARGPGATQGGVIEIRDTEELKVRRQELAELVPFLEGLLRQGLAERVRSADWYVAAAELGLESLADFAAILEAVHSGRTRRSNVSQQLADLGDVRRSLGEFVNHKQDVPTRVQILLDIRQSLERLLRALALTGALGDGEPGSGSRPKALVAELSLDIQRLLRSRRSLLEIPKAIAELGHPWYFVARGDLRRRADELCREHSNWAAELGLDKSESLMSREGRKKAAAATDREIRRMEQRLEVVHKRVYGPRFRERATRDLETDFAEAKLIPVLVDTLAAGSEFLVRAYSAYRHSLELAGADPLLLERVAGLGASVAEAELRLEGAARTHERIPAPKPA